MEEKEKIKNIYILFTIQVEFNEKAENGAGGFMFSVYKTILKSRLFWWDKVIIPKSVVYIELTEEEILKVLSESKDYKLSFEKSFTDHKSFQLVELYFEDVVFDLLTKLKG